MLVAREIREAPERSARSHAAIRRSARAHPRRL